jgi:cytochrome c oxidase subunit 2
MLEKLFYIPERASEHAAAIDHMNDLVHWLMLVLFVGWGIFFAYTLVRFRASRNPKADYTGVKSKFSTWAEIGVALIEAVLLVGFSIPLWAQRVNEVPPDGEGIAVRLVAQQFAWNFWYPGEDGVFGEASPELVDEETNPIGLDRGDPAAGDDITTINLLHLPVDVPVTLHISSKDVIHSFNQPHMRVKQDAVPGMSIPLWWVPTVTTADMRERLDDPEFQYEIACAQLCGNSHYSMRGFVTVHTQEEFDAWLAEEASYLGGDEGDDFWN